MSGLVAQRPMSSSSTVGRNKSIQAMMMMMLMMIMMVSLSAAQKTAEEMGYGVYAFECDKNLDMIPIDERQKKIAGSVYRICMRPNNKAMEDGVTIQRIDSFYWESNTKKGYVEQDAVKNGQGDGALSILKCSDDGKLCYLDTFFKSDFYVDAGSVLGFGEATLNVVGSSDNTVKFEKSLFPHDFKFTMRNPDGSEMNQEDLAKLAQRQNGEYVEVPTPPDEL